MMGRGVSQTTGAQDDDCTGIMGVQICRQHLVQQRIVGGDRRLQLFPHLHQVIAQDPLKVRLDHCRGGYVFEGSFVGNHL